ncbi:MAG: radical SAM protein [Candidatus Bathyarchaeota archaeon]|nr:radical SAM protein [Candidatus Bathyarchaeota archaeon]
MLSLVRRSLKSPRTYHAQWFITRKCNYRCRGCDVWINQDSRELSTGEVKKGLDILRGLGVLEIVLSGGNPLLRDDIGEILDYASKHFITTVYDNGGTAAKKVDALRNVDFVAISLDTLDEAKNDYLKGVPGAWRRAMDSIETLKEEGIHVGVSPTISQVNLSEIIDFTKHFVDRRVPVWYCFYCSDPAFKDGMFSIGKKNDEYEITDRDALVDVFNNVLKMREESEYVYITRKPLEALKHLASTGERTWECRALDSFLVVDHLGRVAGCHSREPVASIFDLPGVWKSAEFNDLRKEYNQCTKCLYLCYIFYSLHAGLTGTIAILRDQWKNARTFLSEEQQGKTANT